MGCYHDAYWTSEGAGQTRAERRSGAYRFYVPTKLSVLELQLSSDVVADIGQAQQALLETAVLAGPLSSIDGLSRFLLRAEAISSSFIEGLRLGCKRLLQAEINESEPQTFKADETAAEIVGNIEALRIALKSATAAAEMTLPNLLNIHHALLAGTHLAEYAGRVRSVQNWIGGNSYNPLGARHIPPAPQFVMPLLEDLVAYCNRTDVSPVQQAALAHAQFETIHPFVDGNGRAGRALIQLLLRRRGLVASAVPPVSLILSTLSESYIGGLNSLRFAGEQPDECARENINDWLSFFAGCCIRACGEVRRFSQQAARLEATWRSSLGSVRRNSALDRLLSSLVGMPLFTVKSAASALGLSYQSLNLAVEHLVEAGIARPLSQARRNRAFEAPAALDAFRAFERQLASPKGDTLASRPVRPVPA
ncbi:MAG: Fic family protein [Coriobacteriales bacterium]|jgi:Fic family protein|nr:Fic family protein [Coriobacteriales bacterium]